MAKKLMEWSGVKNGKDLAKFAIEHGAEIHQSSHGTKLVVPGKGSLMFNITKVFSKHDKSHFARILKLLGLLVLLGGIILAFLIQNHVLYIVL